MVAKDVLSQEEVDALLKQVEDEPETTETADAASTDSFSSITKEKPKDHVEVINFAAQQRIVRGELPVLDKIHDRMARFFSNDIYLLMTRDVNIKQDPLSIIKHKEYFSKVPNPSLMTIFRFKPLRGKAVIIFDSTFIYDLVDFYFGGSSQFSAQSNRTDFTPVELRVMNSVIDKLVRNIQQAWAPIIQLEPIRMNDETNPQLVHIAEAEELLLVSRFNLDFGKEVGSFSLVIPYSMVEPLKQQLELGASRPEDEMDPNWVNSLKDELMEVKLTVSACMAKTMTTLDEVMNWQVGDFVPVEKNKEVTLDIEGIPSFVTTLGTSDEKRALQIIKRITY